MQWFDTNVKQNSKSKVANILVGLYHIREANKYEVNSTEFMSRYKEAITNYTQKSFKLDKEYPITCATFGAYFLPRQAWEQTEKLARKAIEMTDVNAIASDGWYLLARKEHFLGILSEDANWAKVVDFYNRADNARGGGDKGFLPAKFGATQAQIRKGDLDGAKFRLEKIIQNNPSQAEPKVLLGTIYAQEVFENQAGGFKEDKSSELKKAVSYLDTVRNSWKDSKRRIEPDMTLLVLLAHLFEIDNPEKSLQCLLQVQQMSLDNLDEEYQYLDVEEEEARLEKSKAHLPPGLLNNIACFQFLAEKYHEAAANFQLGLNACMNADAEGNVASDQLVTTISYNLARSYEGSGLLDEAKEVYEGLIARHPEYVDARARLAYIELRQNPSSEGPRAMASLYEAESQNMEVRALYGWYLHRAKRRVANIAEDQEQRQYKHTLQQFDKHDLYALTGMGNLHLTTAREMRRESDQDKEKRRKTYERAVEFYHKSLQLDSRNAYAAQGIGIALAEDKRDFQAAMQIFSKVKDTIKASSVLVNLGHIFAELKQYPRAIDNYEATLTKDRANDAQILACLGRVWMLRGKQEKAVAAMKSSLEYSQRALEIAPEQIHFKFNYAFVQMQMAQLIHGLKEPQRSLEDVEAAAAGLEDAINAFDEIAKAKNPPYPPHDLEQRANMGRNTLRKQLERSLQAQREYEEANAEKLAQAREQREKEKRAKEEKERRAKEEEEEHKRKLREERHRLVENAQELAAKKAEDERRRSEAEYTENSEGERVKRKSRRRTKRKEKDAEGEGGAETGEDGERAPRKKRKLANRKPTKNSKYKSADIIVDSDEDDDIVPAATPGSGSEGGLSEAEARLERGANRGSDTPMGDAEGSEDEVAVKPRKKATRRIDDDEDDEDDETLASNPPREDSMEVDDEPKGGDKEDAASGGESE
jgi:RNA polymerase-associated protein CTR9